jgi:rhamnosyltransferase
MKILVILAAYNGAKYIEEQMDSILKQDSVYLDIMVFDDCSTDNTIEVLNKYKSNANVSINKREKGTGNAPRNFLDAILSLTDEFVNSYNFIAFSDQDDIWFPNKMFEAGKMLRKEQSSLYFSNLNLWDENTNYKAIINKSYPQKKYDFLFEGGSAGCTYVFTNDFCIGLKKILKSTNYYDWELFSHDWFVYFYARANGFKVSIDNNAYITYRIHANNSYGQVNKISISAIKERLKYIKNGWYFNHIEEFRVYITPNSVESKIYYLYTKNYFTRLYVLIRYNFELMRSSKKFIQFFIISLLPIRINKHK